MSFTDITVRHQNSVLTEPITFSVETGTSIAVLGASKTGKSTLLLYGAGQAKPRAGIVKVVNEEGQNSSPSGQHIGLGSIEHFAPLFDTLTVQEHLFFHGKLHRVRGAKRRSEELLSEYALSDVRKERVKDINKFAYARLSIAVAAVHRPSFVLLDEPEAGLTEHEWMKLTHYLQELQSCDTGILYTTVLESAALAADQTVTLPDGEVKTAWEFSRSSALNGAGYGVIN